MERVKHVFLHFLYPGNPLKPKQPDDFYAAELSAMQFAGFETSVFSLEAFQAGSFHPYPSIPEGSTVIYRGWMLSASDCEELCRNISASGAKALTETSSYLAAHHLPKWYPLIPEFTPETRIFLPDVDLARELKALGWGEFFLKDYVKSLKTSMGSRISSPEQAETVAKEMCQYRGTIEGGFCVRRVESFLPETERRYFVLDGVPFSSGEEIPEIVSACTRRIQSRFFSVDVIQRKDGLLRIVEVGDGQVSDIVGWTPERFASIFRERFGK